MATAEGTRQPQLAKAAVSTLSERNVHVYYFSPKVLTVTREL